MNKLSQQQTADDLQQITELQVRLTHLENDIEHLNKIVTSQDKELQDVRRQLQLLYRLVNDKSDPEATTFDVFNERPPHY